MQCNAFVERRPFRNLSPYIPQFAITSTTKDISSHETTLRQNAKLLLSSGSDFLLHKSSQRTRKQRRVRVRLTAPETHYLWRAVDHEGEVLESFVTKRRDRRAALAFLKKALKRCGSPKVIVTDRLRSYRAAMVQLGNAKCQETGRWLNNRGENSHLPFRRREYAMQRFRRERTLQKFVSVYSAVCNHFNHERHLISRDDFKGRREAALVEWQQVSAA